MDILLLQKSFQRTFCYYKKKNNSDGHFATTKFIPKDILLLQKKKKIIPTRFWLSKNMLNLDSICRDNNLISVWWTEL